MIMTPKHKQSAFSTGKKLKIIDEMNKGVLHNLLSSEYGVAKHTLSNIKH